MGYVSLQEGNLQGLIRSCGRFVSEDFGPSNCGFSATAWFTWGATNPSDTPWPTARRNMMNPYHPQVGLAWLIPNGQEFYMGTPHDFGVFSYS